MSSTSSTIPLENLGAPGTRGELHVLAIFENETRRDEDRLHDQTYRSFRLDARLGKTPLATETIKGDFTELDGSSYLLIPGDVAHTRIESKDGFFTLHKNTAGEIALMRFQCDAHTPVEAKKKFLSSALPYLDFICFDANGPIHVNSLRIEDLSNHRTIIEYVSPNHRVTIVPHTATLEREMTPIYAMYREARNSSSDFYRFLCYYKILEGLFGSHRSDLFRRAKEKGIQLTRRRDLIPDSPDLEGIYKPLSGRPIKEFLDSKLTPKFRNAMAHFTTDDGSTLNMSSLDDMASFSDVTFVTELCVRTAIANFREMLRELKARE